MVSQGDVRFKSERQEDPVPPPSLVGEKTGRENSGEACRAAMSSGRARFGAEQGERKMQRKR